MMYKRKPSKVLTEKNLARILSNETTKINLENHYWVSKAFLSSARLAQTHLTFKTYV